MTAPPVSSPSHFTQAHRAPLNRDMTVLKRKKFKPLSTTNDKNPGGLNTTNEMNVHNEPGKGVEDRRRRVWVLDNPNFREFYSSQRIVSESEFEPLMKCLGRDLPITYRISCSCEYKEKVDSDLMESMGESIVIDGVERSTITKMAWYPGGLVHKLGFSRKDVRKRIELAEFHELLQKYTDSGAVTRQEEVSMIPPLFMDIKPGMKVLDMCAAPGSKTAQLIELTSSRDLLNGMAGGGMVMANDANRDRAYLLSHQSKRLCAPHLIITHSRAQYFKSPKGFLFDRVLCDVPCSGDGTLRKQPIIWSKWSAAEGVGLHPLQVNIARRGLTLTKLGGRMVYSTCSMNPFENEAVVAALLRMFKGTVELVDVSKTLPLLKRRHGLRTWKVMVEKPKMKSSPKEGGEGAIGGSSPADMFDTYSDFSSVPHSQSRLVRKSLFPPTDDEAACMKLDRCLRFIPIDQDTGGFFVAVFEKIAEDVKDRNEAEAAYPPPSTLQPPPPVEEDILEEQQQPEQKKRQHPRSPKHDGIIPLAADGWNDAKERYGIQDSLSFSNLMTRTFGGTVYFCSDDVRDWILETEATKTGPRIVGAGVRLLECKPGAQVGGRPCYDGMKVLSRHMTKRVVECTARDLSRALVHPILQLHDLSANTHQAIEALDRGIVALKLRTSQDETSFCAIFWKDRAISPMLSKDFVFGIISEMKYVGVWIDEELLETVKT